ncbi:transcription antitermination protein NusG [Klebsiella michiganensis]|uniref:Transcription antitermination protein NusG n=1 Tax=Klebsiella michiganensis TaxID=1134687 RepID=A0A7H4M2C1_9ENTR|nr:transcription antitermination protein NusG [Klebsiella michiganensis]
MSEAPKKRWYVVQAFSGFEGRVATSLREHIKLHNMEELFGEVMVPTEEVVEIRGGQRRKSERKFFPGYVLVQMVMNDASWHLVRSVPRVMGFIGGTSDRPAPISDKEVDAIMTVCSRLAISRGRKRCLSRVKWFALATVHLPTLTVWLKKWTTRSLV